MFKKFWILTKKELKFQWYSKLLIIISLLFIGLCIINYYFLYTNFIQDYQLYNKTEEYMIEHGFNIEEELKKNPRINIEEGIDNVLAYDYQNVLHSMAPFEMGNMLNNTFGWLSFIYFPFIFIIYGILIGTYDFQSKTIKLKLVHSSFISIFISKIISIFLFSIFTMLLISLSSLLIHNIYSIMVHNIISGEGFQVNIAQFPSNISILLFAFMVIFLFSILGLSIGFLTKNPLIPSIIILIINFLVPILGKFDIRNLLANYGFEIFTFNRNIQLFTPEPVSLALSGTIIVSSILILVFIGYYISSKRSKYSI